jgi:hypothetical protein
MLDQEFPIPLDDKTARLACVVVLLGAATIRFGGWTILGCVIVAYGILTLWLAYLIAVAPIYVEPTDTADRADW